MKFIDTGKEGGSFVFVSILGLCITTTVLGIAAVRQKSRSDKLDAIEKSKIYTVIQDDKTYNGLKIRYKTNVSGCFLSSEGKEVTFKGSYVIIEE